MIIANIDQKEGINKFEVLVTSWRLNAMWQKISWTVGLGAWLKLLLLQIISENQNVFLSERVRGL